MPCFVFFVTARSKGLEPSASSVTGKRSNQLSYDRNLAVLLPQSNSGKSIYTFGKKGNILRGVDG